ncbi:uncharacterized protein [Nicotiana sylvestris]|uniref:uncharacterized protein n=1 Tax=Nicotiana sylvestris TaxID=4096 RepID=UPI00388CCBED
MSIADIDTSVIDPSREEEELDVNAMKEEMYKLKQQMAEIYQAWAKGQPPSAYPVNPTFTPPPAQPQDHPATDLSPSFPIYQHHRGTTSHTSQSPPPKPIPYPPPPVTSVFVAPPPATLHKSPSFKMPKFDLYNEHSDLVAHLRGFCSKMRGAGGKDELLMAYFSHDTEKCWHLKSAIQELIDTNRIEVQAPEAPNINRNPMPAHQEANMIEVVHEEGKPRKPSQTIMIIRSSGVKTVEQSAGEKSMLKSSKKSVEPSVEVEKGSLSKVATKQEGVKVIVPRVARKPVIIVEGARADRVIIKPVTQLPIINIKAIPWNYEWVTVMYKRKEIREEVCEAHGLTRSGRCFVPDELRKVRVPKDNPVLVKKVVTEEEAEEFLRKMKVQDYSVVEQLRKTPAQISLLSLLIHSDEHRQSLIKILNEAHVPDKISVNHLEKIAKKIFEVNRVTFSDYELPEEGTEHNRALYLMVKCEDSMVTRVLVDNRSSANIFPLSTLNKLKVDNDRIHKNSICVRGFDGGDKDSVGDIILELTIGPVEFTMEFQVLDLAVSYNLLLGRPWIQVAKVVSSTLHQMVKFEWDIQEIVVHGEDNMCAQSDAIVPFIEVEDGKGPWVYQVFDEVSVEKIPQGKDIPVPKIIAASVMVVSEMLKNGFVPGKGLGASLQSIVQPVSLPKNLDTFGLGFKPTSADIIRAIKLRQKAWVLPKPIMRLSRSFFRPSARKRPTATVSGSLIDVDGDLDKGFEMLFSYVNMVETEEGSSQADVKFVGPSAKISNWEVTLLPTRKELW